MVTGGALQTRMISPRNLAFKFFVLTPIIPAIGLMFAVTGKPGHDITDKSFHSAPSPDQVSSDGLCRTG
jgi:hypothetical protein